MNSHIRARHYWQLLLISMLLQSGTVFSDPVEDGGYWFNLRLQGKLPIKNIYWNMDTSPRFRNEGKYIDALYLRPSIFYKPNPKTSIWLGHDTVIGHPQGKPTYQESRWWEQFQYQFDPIANFTATNRMRLEERERADFHDTGYRLRQMVKISKPLNQHPNLSLSVYDEVFINIDDTDWGAKRGFDQNRLFLGMNWKVNERCQLETGYLNQVVKKTSRSLENHIIATALRFKF